MSLGIAVKSAEGLVLAADSRVTLFAGVPPGVLNLPPGMQGVIPATYDNATKLLRFRGHTNVGAITFGAGAIGQGQAPRTASSYLTEFEDSIAGAGELSVEEFARQLGRFFTDRWNEAGMDANAPLQASMVFYVGGFTGNEPYGRLYDLFVPARPEPAEQQVNSFGAIWGGQREAVDRLIQGFDPGVLDFVLADQALVDQNFQLDDASKRALYDRMRTQFRMPIPWPFLPLQDCVDIAQFLVKATIASQRLSLAVRGVGGAVDLATITRERGFEAVEIKEITTERTI